MYHALIFDSGIGGLSVSAHIADLLPQVRRTYVADDAFRPYGEKSAAALKDRLPALLAVLEIMCAPDVIVIACNTASVTALDEIRAAVTVPVIGVVPAIKPAGETSQTRCFAVLGTPGTVQRDYVDALIQDFASDCHVILKGSTALVDLAERKLAGLALSRDAVASQIESIFRGPNGQSVDSIVLACTHFPLLVEELAAAAPRPINWIDSGAGVARRTLRVIQRLPAPKCVTPQENVALLIGPKATNGRVQTFKTYGYPRVIGLKPTS